MALLEESVALLEQIDTTSHLYAAGIVQIGLNLWVTGEVERARTVLQEGVRLSRPSVRLTSQPEPSTTPDESPCLKDAMRRRLTFSNWPRRSLRLTGGSARTRLRRWRRFSAGPSISWAGWMRRTLVFVRRSS
jgi:hypothetical protein